MNELPITKCIGEIVAATTAGSSVVLKAPPGAGKTTGVPPAIAKIPSLSNQQILLVQPRRLAARGAAAHLAGLMNTELGKRVGYQVRFDRKISNETQVIAITTGILLRRLASDPLLEETGCVILDEFHERSLEMDLALGMLERIRKTLRPELRVLVMSATLDPKPIVDFLGDAIPIVSEGRSFPVTISHTQQHSSNPVDQQIASVLKQTLQSTPGHVLVFLPGVGEIRRTETTLKQAGFGSDVQIMQLYGDLAPKDQDAVLGPSPKRKLILATNVAETSVTIPGVTAVIDSGQARVMQFDPRVGMPSLRLQPISQASAEQRAGRAGRTEPGVCTRLWPANMHRARPQRDEPEILRNDFCSAMLTLAAWGEKDAMDFPWLTPPTQTSVKAAQSLLISLGAIDRDSAITEVGQQMLKIPLHPRVARFLVAAAQYGVQDRACLAAALLTERDPFRGQHHRHHRSAADSASDVLDRVEKLESKHSSANPAAVKHIMRVADQLRRHVPASQYKSDTSDEHLMRSLLAAYPDRVARRRSNDSDRALIVGGRGVRLDRSSNVRSGELFLCIDTDAQDGEALVRAASSVDREWLDDRLIKTVDEPFFLKSSEAVVARRRSYFQDLMLDESPIECLPSPQVADLLFQNALQHLDRFLPGDHKEAAALIGRVRFLTKHLANNPLPTLTAQDLSAILHQVCQGCTSFSELKKAAWYDHLKSRFEYQQLQQLEQLVPEHMKVPSGNSIRIQYAADKPPIMEVRIQELFGWQETPRVAGGKVAVQLHLLGPNYRPQQITEDLANFWKETYLQVRKDLRRRYPKHHWPEDPTSAKATHNGLKPRS